MFQRLGKHVADRSQCHSCPFCPPWAATIREISRHPPRRPFSATTANLVRRNEPYKTVHLKPRKGKATSRLAPLGVQTLGKPGHVIIVKGAADRFGKRRQDGSLKVVEKDGQDTLWQSVSGVLKEAMKCRVALSAQDVIANFDSFRVRHPAGTKLSKPEWTSLRNSLVKSFSSDQLLGYLKYLEESEDAVHRNNGVEGDGEGEQSASAWKPGTSIFMELKPGDRKLAADASVAFRDIRGKTVVAETILREHWNLSVLHETGRLDMEFDPQAFSSLLNSTNKGFKALAEAYGVRIDVWKSRNTITITGPEALCLEVHGELQDADTRIEPREIDLSAGGAVFGVGDEHLEDEFVTWLQKTYNVLCEKDDSARKLILHPTDAKDSDIENAARSAELSLILPLDHSLGVSTYSADAQSAIVYPFLDPDVLTWPDRRKQWARWSKPQPNAAFREGRLTSRPPAATFTAVDEFSNPLFAETDEFYARSKHVREIVTASIGKSLFEPQPPYDIGTETNLSGLRDIQSRTFVPDVPRSRNFLRGLEQLQRDGEEGEICRIRLIPSPRNNRTIPPIELELRLSPQNQFMEANVAPVICRATAILDERSIDMLLPETSVDIRFTKTVHYDLYEGKPPSQLEMEAINRPIISKLRQCVSSLPARYPLSGAQPHMPAFRTLSIPKRFAGPSKERSHDHGLHFIEAEYILPPLNSLISSRLARFIYRDFELDFSSPLTGPLLAEQPVHLNLSLGRYDDELRPPNAFPNRRLSSFVAGDSTESLAAAFRRFYSRACQLAFEVGAASSAIPRVRQEWSDVPI